MGRRHLTVPDDENVIAGTLRHVPLFVQHEPFPCARVLRLELCQDVVQVVQRFDPRTQGGRGGSSGSAQVTMVNPL